MDQRAHPGSEPGRAVDPAETTWPELRPVMADLAHVVHNASTLVLGHVAAVERSADSDSRLHDRVHVIEAALGRINDVVDGLRAAVDPTFWGDPRPALVDQVVEEAFETCAGEAGRRRIRLVLTFGAPSGAGPDDPADGGLGPDRLVTDGARATAAIGALVASALDRLGSDGSITVAVGSTPDDEDRIQITACRDDGLVLHDDSRSVWEWIAAQLACQFGATVSRLDAATTTLIVPVLDSVIARR